MGKIIYPFPVYGVAELRCLGLEYFDIVPGEHGDGHSPIGWTFPY